MTIAFDTHAYIKELRTVGVSEPQAEVQAHALIKIVENDLATKQDTKELEASTSQKIKELEVLMIHKIKELELSTKRDIAEAKNDIIKWVAGMLIAQSGVMFTLFKLFASN